MLIVPSNHGVIATVCVYRINSLLYFFISAVLVVSQVLVMQWSIGKGMVDYVNEREFKALNGVAASLAEMYQNAGSWQHISGKHQRFKNVIVQGLADSEFSQPQGNRPPHQPRVLRPMVKRLLRAEGVNRSSSQVCLVRPR
jgi:hypothetical protein